MTSPNSRELAPHWKHFLWRSGGIAAFYLFVALVLIWQSGGILSFWERCRFWSTTYLIPTFALLVGGLAAIAAITQGRLRNGTFEGSRAYLSVFLFALAGHCTGGDLRQFGVVGESKVERRQILDKQILEEKDYDYDRFSGEETVYESTNHVLRVEAKDLYWSDQDLVEDDRSNEWTVDVSVRDAEYPTFRIGEFVECREIETIRGPVLVLERHKRPSLSAYLPTLVVFLGASFSLLRVRRAEGSQSDLG